MGGAKEGDLFVSALNQLIGEHGSCKGIVQRDQAAFEARRAEVGKEYLVPSFNIAVDPAGHSAGVRFGTDDQRGSEID